MKIVDKGKYNKDSELFGEAMNELYERYPDGITLPPPYAFFVNEDFISFLIKLARYKFTAKLLKKTDRILEVGSGPGLGAIFLSQFCQHVTGLEIKTNEIEEARAMSKRDNVEFIQEDFFNLSEEHKYDAIVSLDVIEHLPMELGDKMVAKMAKHINNDGMLILGTPSIYSYPYQGAISQASHVKCYDKQELIQLIDQYFARTISFSMNDEMVHTGHPKMAWYYFVVGFLPK